MLADRRPPAGQLIDITQLADAKPRYLLRTPEALIREAVKRSLDDAVRRHGLWWLR